MRNLKVKDITKFCDALWEDDSSYGCDKEIIVNKFDNEYAITVSAMYEAPGLTFEKLLKLSEYFGTQNINDDDRFGHGGCETCDYGSEYGFTLTVRPD